MVGQGHLDSAVPFGLLTGCTCDLHAGNSKLRSMQPLTEETSWALGPLFCVNHRILTPPLYRSMAAKYVDQFFEKGTLRISSFRHFAKHPDELHRDAEESTGMVSSIPVNGMQGTVFLERNENALILCASVRSDLQSFTGERYDGCLRINRTRDFASALARCVPGVVEVMEGFCIYREQRIMMKPVGAVAPNDLQDDVNPNLCSPKKLSDLAARFDSPTRFFLKERRHEKEAEYRIIWLLDHPTPDYLDVDCPGAIPFCTRVSVERQGAGQSAPTTNGANNT